MKLSSGIVFSFVLATAVSFTARAQIYESRDADGNKVYSDTPAAGAKEVELERTNIADPVKDMPPAAPAPAGVKSHSVPAKSPDRATPEIEGSWTPAESDERRTVQDADSRREVLDAEPRDEVQGAEQRDEKLEGQQRREIPADPERK